MPIMQTVIQGGGGSAPTHYIEKTVDANGKLGRSPDVINMNGVVEINTMGLKGIYYNNTFDANTTINWADLTTVGQQGLYECFYQSTGIISVNMPVLTNIGEEGLFRAFYKNTTITTVSFSALNNISETNSLSFCFFQNTALTTASLSNLEKITGTSALRGTFYGCSNLINVYMNKLTIVNAGSAMGGYTDYGFVQRCTSLQTLNMPKLVYINGNDSFANFALGSTSLSTVYIPSLKYLGGTYIFDSAFKDTSLSDLSFPALKTVSASNQLSNMLLGVTGCTVHFPSNLQSTMSGWASVTGGFGGTNTTVLFDLPATVILTGANSINYERSPKDDTATALAWRVQDTGTLPNITIDWTPYYTSGTTDPAVSDTIYSDAACTTAVTTVSAIA